jgi:hypothetical protein
MSDEMRDRAQWRQDAAVLVGGGNVTYAQLAQVRLGSLEQAVEKWAGVRDRLEDMAGRARQRMLAPARSGDWQGENAGVTVPFIEATAGKFDYAHQQADALHTLLQELSTVLGDSKRSLGQVEAEAAAEGVRFDQHGVARTVEPPYLALADAQSGLALGGGVGEYEGLSAAQVSALTRSENAMRRVLEGASESEEVTLRAIQEILAQRPGEFTPTLYADGADAAEIQMLADADRFVELSRGEGALTPQDAARQLELLEEHAEDPAFAARVIDGMGMDAFLQLSQRADAGATQLDGAGVRVDTFQEGLGNTLASAMRPPADLAGTPVGSAAWQAWTQTPEGQRYQNRLGAFHEAGTERLHWENPVLGLYPSGLDDPRLGYDVALDLLDQASQPISGQFFTEALTGMVEAEKNDPAIWAENRYSGEDGWDVRNDAVDRLLNFGAQHNQDAVTAYFDPRAEGGEEHLDYFLGGADDEGARQVDMTLSESDFLGSAFLAMAEPPGLIAALEVASTGTLPGEPTWSGDGHSDTNIAVAEHIWNRFGEDRSDLTGLGERFVPLLGHIGAEYIADLQNAANGGETSVGHTPEANFDTAHSGSLLWEIGKDPEVYERITAANQTQLILSVDAAVNGDYSESARRDEAVDSAVYRGGYVAGLMADAHTNWMVEEQIAADEAHNADIQEVSLWIDRGLDVAIYQGLSDAPGAAALVDELKNDLMTSITRTYEADNSIAARHESQDAFDESRRAYQDLVEDIVESAYGGAGVGFTDDDETARGGHEINRAGEGHDDGASRRRPFPSR